MTVVLLGNRNPMTQIKVMEEGATVEQLAAGGGMRQVTVRAAHLNFAVTRVEMPDDVFDPDYVDLCLTVNPTGSDNDRLLAARAKMIDTKHRNFAVAVHDLEAIMGVHSGGVAPAWVSCPENKDLQKCLAGYFQAAEGEPTALVTNGGIDWYFQQILGSPGAALAYGALTANTTAPGATDTTLTGEIVTAGGGLLRTTMTYAHTAGTTTGTLTHTWTANGSDSLPVTIGKWGQFSASSAGTMGSEDLISPTATLSASGDSLSLTFTLTL